MKQVNPSVTELAVEMARRMRFSEEEIRHLKRGAIFHDIGELGIPHNILQKPARLTEEEREQMMKHPQIAYDLMSSFTYLKAAADIVYCHHEKWDGTGYPRGLKGEQIPIAARIFALVDVWDAIRSGRPYSPACSDEVATAYIIKETGKHFDPEVVKVFFEVLRGMEKAGTESIKESREA